MVNLFAKAWKKEKIMKHSLFFALCLAMILPACATKATVNDTFTKWVTTSPPAAGVVANMVGVVGGDVGSGVYAGEILTMNTVGNTTSIHALYHFNGSKHAFTADVNITQDDSAGTAVIAGKVTDGWLKGASVTGEYNVLNTCPIDTPDNAYGTMCFQGALHIQVPK